ncbi:MAG: sensor histidine kinase [Micrococcus sp.]|nr:sensor histidine kinase [Micrococcus sp.]
MFAVSVYFRIRDGAEPVGYVLGYESVSNIALFAAAIALGYNVRARRIRAAPQAEIARLTGEQHVREAQRQVQNERERISRELHDTVGHTMSVISLQSAVAAEAVGSDDAAVYKAVEHIRDASTRSLREVRSMVRILRAGELQDETRGIQSLASVAQLVDTARAADVEVSTDITAEPSELPAPVDTAAYRVIQESITNVIHHAGARHAHVQARIQDGHLLITVTDVGHGQPLGDHATGYGLVGMSERVRLLGGSLTTHSNNEGFNVEARFPGSLP